MSSRRFFVTGINRGLGRSLATVLVDRGHEVWGSTRSGESDVAVAGCVRIDLGDARSVDSGMDELRARIDALDVLVNCAGTDARAFGAADDARGPFDLDAETLASVLVVNVTGPMLVTMGALDLLRARDASMIVNVSSQLGSMQVAARKGRDTAYCVSKAALNMLSVKSAAELRSDGIGVVMMHPGWLNTDMGGSDADGDVDLAAAEIERTIAALTIDDSGRFIRWDGSDHPW